jgi:hypothetical protein
MTVLLAVNQFMNYPSGDDGKPLSIVWIIIRTIPNLFVETRYQVLQFINIKNYRLSLIAL